MQLCGLIVSSLESFVNMKIAFLRKISCAFSSYVISYNRKRGVFIEYWRIDEKKKKRTANECGLYCG